MGDLKSCDMIKAAYETSMQYLNSENEATRYMDIACNLFNEYKEIIKKCFVGKQDEIKSIYDAIKFNKYPWNKINCIDLDLSIHLYFKYLEGMVEFIQTVTDLNDNDGVDINSIKNTIEQVSTKDTEYVNSLFGGEPSPSKECSLNDTMKNVEVMIDMDETIKDFMKLFEEMNTHILRNNSTKYEEVIREGMRVFTTSILNFTCFCFSSIIDSYDDIINSIQHRESINPKKEKPKYQLF